MPALLLLALSKVKNVLSSLSLSHGALLALGIVIGYEGHGIIKLALSLLKVL